MLFRSFTEPYFDLVVIVDEGLPWVLVVIVDRDRDVLDGNWGVLLGDWVVLRADGGA